MRLVPIALLALFLAGCSAKDDPILVEVTAQPAQTAAQPPLVFGDASQEEAG
jgi:PBP1b-binding outer membrane lipoprotein LpoB